MGTFFSKLFSSTPIPTTIPPIIVPVPKITVPVIAPTMAPTTASTKAPTTAPMTSDDLFTIIDSTIKSNCPILQVDKVLFNNQNNYTYNSDKRLTILYIDPKLSGKGKIKININSSTNSNPQNKESPCQDVEILKKLIDDKLSEITGFVSFTPENQNNDTIKKEKRFYINIKSPDQQPSFTSNISDINIKSERITYMCFKSTAKDTSIIIKKCTSNTPILLLADITGNKGTLEFNYDIKEGFTQDNNYTESYFNIILILALMMLFYIKINKK
jgi:hypothetical protein